MLSKVAGMSVIGNWSYPTDIRFGAGRISELPEVCASLGMKRPLLVTDGGLVDLPMLRDAVNACQQAGLGIAVFRTSGVTRLTQMLPMVSLRYTPASTMA